MLTTNTISALDKLIPLLGDNEVKAVPRIIVVDSDWRKSITDGIFLDRPVFTGTQFNISCQFASSSKIEFKGSLELALHNVLASVERPGNMVITVENIITKFVKGVKAKRSMKLVYIVLKNCNS